mgnify:CR=1 FL=1
MNAIACLGPVAIEIELREVVRRAGGEVFMLEIDETSILVSMNLVLGDAMSRHAHYVRDPLGRRSELFIAMRDWILRKAKEHAAV